MAKKAKEPATEVAVQEEQKPAIIAFKGFGMNWTCRDYQFEVGKTFKMDGPIKACERGFHACEHPLNVFEYYAPATSRFAEVELRGDTHRKGDDTKIAAAEITIKAELKIPDLVARAIQWVIDQVTTTGGEHVTGDQSAASATGYQSAASATGNRSAASATGNRSAASATGYQSAASATGDQSAASATGYQSAASATGDQSAAMACGYQGSVSGKAGNALFLVERNDKYDIIAVWAGIAGKDGIEPDTAYTLRDGKPVKA